jgi:hypothetical protein
MNSGKYFRTVFTEGLNQPLGVAVPDLPNVLRQIGIYRRVGLPLNQSLAILIHEEEVRIDERV